MIRGNFFNKDIPGMQTHYHDDSNENLNLNLKSIKLHAKRLRAFKQL